MKELKNLNLLFYEKNPPRIKTLSNVKFLEDLVSDATKTSEGKVVSHFGHNTVAMPS